MRRLERYKKCRSYCSLEANHSFPTTPDFPTEPGGGGFKFRLPPEHHKSASSLSGLFDRDAGHCSTAITIEPSSMMQPYPPPHSHFSQSSSDLTLRAQERHRPQEFSGVPGRAFLTGDSNFVVDSEGSPVNGIQTPPTPSAADIGPLGTIAEYNAVATDTDHRGAVTNQFEVLREKMVGPHSASRAFTCSLEHRNCRYR